MAAVNVNQGLDLGVIRSEIASETSQHPIG
jgi:hypothetical protein